LLTRRLPGRGSLILALAAGLGVSMSRGALAQSTAQIPLQFDFQTPGARSMAMGGAFIGAADDASAAFTNPAGLAFLTAAGKREISAEGRFSSVETPFLAGGRISGMVTGNGIDTVPNPVYGEDIDREVRPGFVSLVVPIRQVVVTAYRHQMVGLENTFFSDGVFERFTFAGITDDNNREIPLGGTRQIAITTYGGSLGYKLNDKIAVGAGIGVNHFTLQSDFARFGFASSIFGAVSRSLQSATATQAGDDIGVSANIGRLAKLSDRVQVAATVRRGARFEFSQRDRVFDSGLDLTRSGQFKVPDVWGAGLQWRAAENVRVVADYDRVQYGQLKRDFIDIQSLSSGRQDQIRLDDANEIHGGVEYQWLRSGEARPLAFRAGAWFDPAHAPRYVSTAAHDELDVLLSAALPGGPNLVHYTFGAGVLLLNSLELNAAADLSSRTTAVTTSLVLRF
jgi:long-chain fatty acid transport protein